jgi:hypothetical protein
MVRSNTLRTAQPDWRPIVQPLLQIRLARIGMQAARLVGEVYGIAWLAEKEISGCRPSI